MKTRLAAEIGDEQALSVYTAMLRSVLARVGTSDERTEIEVLWAPTAAANGDSLRAAFGETHALAMQTGETLGDRLSMAFSERFFFHRTHRIIAIGVDEPAITRELIDHAFALLESVEWVVGPATDGGYYLIGCRGASFSVEAFSGIEWGTAAVLEATMARIRDLGATVATLPERSDIDTSADLQRFVELHPQSDVAKATRE